MSDIRSQKVGLSDCRSLGSNQHQSGRSAKVSIGITVEKSPRASTVVSGIRKEHAPALQSLEKHSSCKGRVKSRSHGEGDFEISKVGIKEQKFSECLQSSSHKTSNSDAGKSNVNHEPVSAHRKVDGLAYKHNIYEDGDTYVDKKLTFTAMHKTNLLDHEISREPPGEVDKCTNGLKMKLWEILGSVPSQKEHIMNSPKLDEDKENIGVNHNIELRKDKAARPKHCSDPIETDSDSPNQNSRRPATRSMSRKKKAPNKIVRSLDDALNSEKKQLSSTCSDYKHKFEDKLEGHANEKKQNLFDKEENRRMQNQKEYAKCKAYIELGNITDFISENKPNVQIDFKDNDKEGIFSFGKEVTGNKRTSKKSANARSKKFNKKRNGTIENGTIGMKAISPPSGSSSKSTLQKVEKEKKFLSTARGVQRIETSPCLPCPSKKRTMQPKNVLNDSQNSQMNRQNLSDIPLLPKVMAYKTLQESLPEREKGYWENFDSSSIPKFTFQCDKAACSPVTSSVDASDDLKSPTFAATPSTPSMPSNEIIGSPPRRNITFSWNFRSSNMIVNDKPGACGSETDTKSSDDTKNDYESCGLQSGFERSENKGQLSLSPVARHDFNNFGAKDLKIKEFSGRNKWVPNVDNSTKSPLKPHKKRIHGLKDAELSEGDEANDLHEASDLCIEDSLARAVNQLALALQRIKSKIQLHTNKKSCEILAAVANKINLQFKNVDSQIQEDMGKLSGSSKIKRKRLESRLGEHQEKIRLIHNKFKEEVNQHLLNCSSTLEELEAHDFEMKGIADRQKILHRKLILQMEESMKGKLLEAEKNIAAVRKEAKKKFNNLKFALKEWVGEGAMS